MCGRGETFPRQVFSAFGCPDTCATRHLWVIARARCNPKGLETSANGRKFSAMVDLAACGRFPHCIVPTASASATEAHSRCVVCCSCDRQLNIPIDQSSIYLIAISLSGLQSLVKFFFHSLVPISCGSLLDFPRVSARLIFLDFLLAISSGPFLVDSRLPCISRVETRWEIEARGTQRVKTTGHH